MNISFLEKQNFIELKELVDELSEEFNNMNTKNKTKKELVNMIYLFFKDYEKTDKKFKKSRIENKDTSSSLSSSSSSTKKYTILNQIGNVGKDGTTYLVKDKKNKEYAMKTFKKNKSKKNILQEAQCQLQASKLNICPKIYDFNVDENYIVMDKLDSHLYEIMKKQKGNLTKTQQEDVYNIFQKLDETKVFHGDSNILNYMYDKDNKLYIIDFGMSKIIDDGLKKKLKADNPNQKLMTLGFVLKLKELKCPPSAYSFLLTKISDSDKKSYGLDS
jgi:tRNA A-37 threonylcarbamoyl transferase component Bud32